MIHISGSIAYDRIMTFPGKFEEHILPEKLHILNVSFQVDSVIEHRGGTAGNIAYSLALLGEKAKIYSSVGKDFTLYAKAFKELDIPLDTLHIDEELFTASCYITTDLVANQIAAFSPAAMAINVKEENFPKANPNTDWAIISPGNLEDMLNLSRHYAKNNVKTVFDPGQQIVVLPLESLKEAVNSAYLLIGNDYEIEKISQNLGLTHAELAQKVPYLITTYGDKGSSIEGREAKERIDIAPVKADAVVDPTGCGDSYRSGLLKGLSAGLSIEEAAQIASTTASFCVEQNGTQVHTFTLESFKERHVKHFNSFPNITF